MNCSRTILVIVVMFFLPVCLPAQETIISGRVTESGSNNGMPFVNLFFKGSVSGTVTNFEGYYSISTTTPADSLYASYLGYKSKAKRVKKGRTQELNFQLEQGTIDLTTVVIKPGENPALRIINKAIRNKELYNKTNLDYIQYESYAKQEVVVDNITERMRKWRIFRPVTVFFDSLDYLVGEDSKANLPVGFSESVAEVYYQKDPTRKREDIDGVRINFVGMREGNAAAQLSGVKFENYNFYNDNVSFFRKDFLSPIANGAFIFYNYYLLDSLWVGNNWCYKINVKPKNKRDLAFTGTLWIADTLFVVKQLDLEITKDVNLNFIERVKIQQELVPTAAGPWMPSKTQVLIDYPNAGKRFMSFIVKIYESNRNFKVNEPKEKEFYDKTEDFSEDVLQRDSAYWRKERHEQLNKTEEKSFEIIDTVRKLPFVRRTIGALYFLATGYTSNTGPIEFGHYALIYARNSHEGDRFRIGFRTNKKLSKDWIIRGYGAYGLRDQKFKYNAQLERIITRSPWTRAGIQYRDDIDQIGLSFDYARNSSISGFSNNLYAAGSQIGQISKLVRKRESRTWIERELRKGLTQKITFQNIYTSPLFKLAYGDDPFTIFLQRDYRVTELIFDTRLSMEELYVQNGNERLSLGNVRSPVFTLNYTLGLSNVLGGDFNYHQLSLSASQRISFGPAGYTKYTVKAGKVFSGVPYTLLEIHRGNETPFLSSSAFNLMNYFEFVSDQYISAHVQHHFQGLLFNRVPLLKRWSWREVLSINAVYGNLSRKNQLFNSYNDFNVLTARPYVEAAAGIENILDFFRVDFVYRLTYADPSYKENYRLNNPDNKISSWGLRFALQFAL